MLTSPSPRSRSLRITTFLCNLLFLIICLPFGYSIVDGRSDWWVGLIVIFFLLFVEFITIAITPRYVSVDDEFITIHKVLGTKRIPRKEVERIEPFRSTISLRVFGIGGLYSYSGWFSNSELGLYRCYCTDFDHRYVLFLRSSRPIVLSVEDPSIFGLPLY